MMTTDTTVTAAPQRFEDHIGLIHLQAKFGLRWAGGAGVQMEYDDMYQEASLAFIAASAGFNPDAGVKFSAYYTKVAFSQFRKTIGAMTGLKKLNDTQRAEIAERRAENKRRGAAALAPLPDINYGIRATPFSAMGAEGDDEFSPYEGTLESLSRSPEELLEAKQELQQATAKLSPLAQLVVEWLKSPPPELLKELAKSAAYASYSQASGAELRQLQDGLTINSIGKFLRMVDVNLRQEDTMQVRAELMNVVKQLERQE